MGMISREEFLAQQARKSENRTNADSPRVGYFKLEKDDQETVVRFIYQAEEDLYNDIVITHKTTVDGKFRRVNCLRNYNEPIDKCPLCAKGDQSQQRFYIKLLEYTRDDNGNVVATPKIWERPTSYVSILTDKFKEYGNLSDYIFKVRRHGKPGDMKTTYTIDFANPTIYNATLYPKDFSVFDNYKIVGTAVLDKSFEELSAMNGVSPAETPAAPTVPTNTQPRKVTY